jgi:hypothetical protein
VRDETPILTLMLVAEEAIGMIPDGSVTMGAHEPATAVTWQVMVVGAVTEMLKQSMFENFILFTVVGMLVPVMVKVVPE